MNQYTLYFGSDIKGIDLVTRSEFNAFCKMIITQYFDGFTVQPPAIGYWKGTEEVSYIVEIVTDNESSIVKIAQYYCKRFQQDSVLIIKDSPEIDFISA